MTEKQLRGALLDLAEFGFVIVNSMEDAEQVKAALNPSLHVTLHETLASSIFIQIQQSKEE